MAPSVRGAFDDPQVHPRAGGPGSSALVRMPTGTGKSGVIAVAAQRLVTEGDTLCLTPWRVLAEQLSSDITERFWARINTLAPGRKAVRRLLPSTAMSLLTGGRPGTIWVATTPTLQQLFSDYAGAYELLASRVKLVIVDEGHYEPAPAWSAAVRGLCRPTVLFSATPYRNDLKYFNISPLEYCYQFSHEEAEEQAYVRGVRFKTIAFDSPQTFCDSLLELLGADLSSCARGAGYCQVRHREQRSVGGLRTRAPRMQGRRLSRSVCQRRLECAV